VGYSNIRDNRRHEADAARIRELEAELKKERAARLDAKTENHQSPSPAAGVGAGGTVTVERTSKRLKGQLVASWVAIFLGVCVAYAEPMGGAVVIAVGFFALVCTKILIWWRHG